MEEGGKNEEKLEEKKRNPFAISNTQQKQALAFLKIAYLIVGGCGGGIRQKENITVPDTSTLVSVGSLNLGLKYMDSKPLESSCSSQCIKQFTLGNVAYKILILY